MAMARTITMTKRGEDDSHRKKYLHDAAIFYSALAATEACCTRTPVQGAFNEWRVARDAVEGADSDAFASLHDCAMGLADQVVHIEAKTPRDLILKMAAYTNFFEHAPCDGPLGQTIYEEALQWVGECK